MLPLKNIQRSMAEGWVIFDGKRALVGQKPRETADSAGLTLSVVVIGRNEGQRLARCLKSIRDIRGFEKIQLIYADSASTDGSAELAAQYGAEVVVVYPDRPTAAIGRNAGWRRASEEFVLFLDGDTVLHPDFPRAAFDAMTADCQICAVWGHRREMHPGQLDLQSCPRSGLESTHQGSWRPAGGDVLMRRSALIKAGGYDEQLIAGEEPELVPPIACTGWYSDSAYHRITPHDRARSSHHALESVLEARASCRIRVRANFR